MERTRLEKSLEEIAGVIRGMDKEEVQRFFERNSGIAQWLSTLAEVTALKSPEDAAKIFKPMVDYQTMLYSKILEEHILPAKMRQAEIEGLNMCYGKIDVDGFGNINKTPGLLWKAGDLVLGYVAGILRTQQIPDRRQNRVDVAVADESRRGDRRQAASRDIACYVGRVGGGEEFGFILYNTNEFGAYKALDRIRRKIGEKPVVVSDDPKVEIPVTVSGGVAQYLLGMKPEDLVAEVNQKLSRAKQLGKNMIIQYL